MLSIYIRGREEPGILCLSFICFDSAKLLRPLRDKARKGRGHCDAWNAGLRPDKRHEAVGPWKQITGCHLRRKSAGEAALPGAVKSSIPQRDEGLCANTWAAREVGGRHHTRFKQRIELGLVGRIALAFAAEVWCGVVWCGVVWCGVVWCDLVRCDTL
jgi:hypothetical protein